MLDNSWRGLFDPKTPPQPPAQGTRWIDTTEDVPVLRRWLWGQWVEVARGDAAIQKFDPSWRR